MVKWATELQQNYKEIEPLQFYRTVFPEGSLDKKDEFNHGKFVGIACEFTKEKKQDGKQLVKRHTITDDLEQIEQLLESNNFIIISPISYIGKSRTTQNARVMYAFAIEVDNLRERDGKPVGLNDLIHHFEIQILPTPNYIVASGNGLHLYYLLETPLLLYENVKKSLMNYKRELTPILWNRYVTTDYEKEKIQFESAFQGFRLVGGVTKDGDRTRVFEVTSHPVSVDYLNSFVSDENKIECAYQSELTLEEAKNKYPEWYERRIIEKKPRGTWTCKRDLYEWWKQKIKGAVVGHRFNCLFLLSIYAIKCGVEQDELEKDMCEYLQPYDEMSIDELNRFTEKDIADALQAFDDKDLITYPINSIEKRSGFTIKRNKRNYRKQEVHLMGARAIQEINDKVNGTNWRDGNGRKSKKQTVKEWQMSHPEGRKADCVRDTGLSKPTVYRWWK